MTSKFLFRVVAKALMLFFYINLIVLYFGLYQLGSLSIYNGLVPGRPRFPFGESPREAYNFSLFDLDAMFASHEISAPKAADEYRVVVIGDSSVWGTLLRPEETLAGQLNTLNIQGPPGKRVKFYNLGYPTISLTKDLLILDIARAYHPDLVIWNVTLEAFPRDKQVSVPLLQNNVDRTVKLIRDYRDYDVGDPSHPIRYPKPFWEKTLIGGRKDIADDFRLQLYGIPWAATGIDQLYPTDYPRASVDLEADPNFHGKPDVSEKDLALNVLLAGKKALGSTPLIIVNEPVMVSTGKNSDVRYNFYYPRKAYDSYRKILEGFTQQAGLAYLDAWNIAPVEDFTNSAIHLNKDGTARLAEAVRGMVEAAVGRGN